MLCHELLSCKVCLVYTCFGAMLCVRLGIISCPKTRANRSSKGKLNLESTTLRPLPPTPRKYKEEKGHGQTQGPYSGPGAGHSQQNPVGPFGPICLMIGTAPSPNAVLWTIYEAAWGYIPGQQDFCKAARTRNSHPAVVL